MLSDWGNLAIVPARLKATRITYRYATLSKLLILFFKKVFIMIILVYRTRATHK